MTTVYTRRPTPRGEPRRLRARLPYVLLAACMALFAYAFIQRLQEVRGLQAQQAALQVQNRAIQQRVQALRRQVRYEHTSAFIMSAARSTFGYTLPNEVSLNAATHRQVVRVQAAPAVTPTPGPSWQAWWTSLTARH